VSDHTFIRSAFLGPGTFRVCRAIRIHSIRPSGPIKSARHGACHFGAAPNQMEWTMSRRTTISLAIAATVGISSFVFATSDAMAYRVGVARAGVVRGTGWRGAGWRGGYWRPGLGLGAAAVGAAAVGAAAYNYGYNNYGYGSDDEYYGSGGYYPASSYGYNTSQGYYPASSYGYNDSGSYYPTSSYGYNNSGSYYPTTSYGYNNWRPGWGYGVAAATSNDSWNRPYNNNGYANAGYSQPGSGYATAAATSVNNDQVYHHNASAHYNRGSKHH
jgi:hypothetical protein